MTKSAFTPQYDRFRQLLVEARHDAGLTQDEVADALSKPQSFVSKFEWGERRLDIVEFLEVANAIGFDPVAFIQRLIGHSD